MAGVYDLAMVFVVELLLMMIVLEMIRSMRFGCYFLKAMFTRYPSELIFPALDGRCIYYYKQRKD